MAEFRTVESDAANRQLIFDAARRTASGQTEVGRVVGMSEREYMDAAFTARASGFTSQQVVNIVPQSALLGVAGQVTAQEAQHGLSAFMNFFPELSAAQGADMMARTQDVGRFQNFGEVAGRTHVGRRRRASSSG